MLRKRKLISCLLISIIAVMLCFTGCAKEQTTKSEEKKEEDLSWFDEAIDNFNNAQYGEVRLENKQTYSDGSTIDMMDKSKIDRKENVLFLESRDGGTYYFQTADNISDVTVSDGNGQTYQIGDDHPMERVLYSTALSLWKRDETAENLEFEKIDEVDGKKTIKLKRTFITPEEETLAGMLMKEGLLTEAQIAADEVFKKAVEENKKGITEVYYWFDAQSHELIRNMTDMTTELFISEYLNASENGTEQEKTIESWIMTTTYSWPKEYEPITMPS